MIGDHHSAERNKGVVMLETIVVLPLLLVLMLVTAEFGQAFWQYSALTKSLRDGARFASSASLLGSTGIVVISDELQTNVRNVVVYGNTAGAGAPVLTGFTTADVTVTYVGANNVEVTASHAISGILGPILRTFYAGPDVGMVHNLQATITMRAL